MTNFLSLHFAIFFISEISAKKIYKVNFLLSEENVNLFMRKGIITSVSNTTEDV